MNEWSINALYEVTGIDRRTIKKRLDCVKPARFEGKGKKRAALYRGPAAFKAIFGGNGQARPKLLESEERIAAAEARIKEVKAAEEEGRVVEVELVAKAWEAIITGAKQKLLALGNTFQSRYGNDPRARKIIDDLTDEICTDLSKPPDFEQAQPEEMTDA